MEWQAQEFQKRSGIACETHLLAEEIPRWTPTEPLAVFRIFQETLTNVARHADASKVVVDLRSEAESLILAVRDNGKGIDESDDFRHFWLDRTSGHPRAGDRLWRNNGSYRRCREHGTCVTVRIPIG